MSGGFDVGGAFAVRPQVILGGVPAFGRLSAFTTLRIWQVVMRAGVGSAFLCRPQPVPVRIDFHKR